MLGVAPRAGDAHGQRAHIESVFVATAPAHSTIVERRPRPPATSSELLGVADSIQGPDRG